MKADEDQGCRHRIIPIPVTPDNNQAHNDHGGTEIQRLYPHEQLRLAS
jgi:hypothetical protein